MTAPIKIIPPTRPPIAGDLYEDSAFGVVKLIKPSGGDSWCCKTSQGTRLYLRPKLIKRMPDDAT